MPEIRPFARHDRDQLTDLVNAHIKAIIPGCSIPVATLLSQMERDPGEYIVDPWVIERETWGRSKQIDWWRLFICIATAATRRSARRRRAPR